MSYAIAVDLDDTLYEERTYVESGFRAVASLLAAATGDDPLSIHAALMAELAASGRGKVFDAVLASLGTPRAISVEACVDAYRTHVPTLSLASGAAQALDQLSSWPLYLVTDGDPDVQHAKIAALGIEPAFRAVYRTWSFGRDHGKPSLACFEMARRDAGVEWAQFAYIADDPSKDFVSLNEVGAVTVRVLTGRCASDKAPPGHDARFRAGSFAEAASIVMDFATSA